MIDFVCFCRFRHVFPLHSDNCWLECLKLIELCQNTWVYEFDVLRKCKTRVGTIKYVERDLFNVLFFKKNSALSGLVDVQNIHQNRFVRHVDFFWYLPYTSMEIFEYHVFRAFVLFMCLVGRRSSRTRLIFNDLFESP